MDFEKELQRMPSHQVFSSEDVFKVFLQTDPHLGRALFLKRFAQLTQAGHFARVGRDAYVLNEGKRVSYRYAPSPKGEALLAGLLRHYPQMKAVLFESVQYNEFVNHLFAHNTIFLSIPRAFGADVFEALKGDYDALLLFPNVQTYTRYWREDSIVITPLLSEAPLGKETPHQACLEKILVDSFASPLLEESLSVSEWPALFTEAFARYIIDEDTLFRYARRRHCEEKLLHFIQEQTSIRLWTKR